MNKTSRIFLQPHTAVAHQENMIRSRRGFLKGIALGAAAVIAAPVLSRASAYAAEAGGNKVLILYFSHSGNTRRLAGQIHGRVGGDMVELKTAVPYPQDYDAVVDMAQKEQQSNARPQIATEIHNWDEYHTVFIGFPNWWGTMPMPFFTFLEKYSMGDKNVIPFCTHEGSRLGRSESDLRKLCPQAHMLKGFEVRGSRVSSAQKDVDAWLDGLGFPARN